ncbi:nitrogen fixation NifU-like protein [Motilibacter rhizosphaerae]|uniref:Nitrogen fixation NifU-like protein n=1 Tax=Motilibacter rhizosphaerae TaxID=598652 RepID=A0A4Q7NG58_9ACTN|nr:SUF system NifU family Fe-S cluster assembly protein [Motilibacter rhizosphaerae]RZS82789.1 nitrogen fixation NifU-like protein [Motilibacter rhizosphaerae]
MSVEALYQDVILDHYRNPRHAGLREPFTTEAHHVNPTCGDEVTLRVRLSADGATVEDVSYSGEGCSISQASTSVLSELVVGQPVEEGLRALDAFQAMLAREAEPDEELLGDGIAFVGVARFPARVKCALLGWMAWKDATARAVAGTGTGTTSVEDGR